MNNCDEFVPAWERICPDRPQADSDSEILKFH